MQQRLEQIERNMDQIIEAVNYLERRSKDENEALKQQIAELARCIERLEKTTRQRIVIRKG